MPDAAATASLWPPGATPAPGLLFVLSGPSGVGKDVALNLMRAQGFSLHFVVTTTSRPPRPGEVEGRDYNFVSNFRFQEMITNDELLEWAMVYGEYKGIPKEQIRRAIASGHDVMLRIDVQGAATVRRLLPDAVFIFLAPASLEELVARLQARLTETPETLARRLERAPVEMHQLPNFDYMVINRHGYLEIAVEQIKAIIIAERCRVHRRRVTI
jgi:guanylate kinase